MKKILGLVALATLVLASCQKNEGLQVDQQLKSVTLNLANVKAPTRADGAMIEETTKVNLNTVHILFSDGNNFYPAHDVDGNVVDTYYDLAKTELTTINNTVFHYLNAAVTKVYVLGNTEDVDYANVAAISGTLSTAATVDKENDAENLFLYAYGELTRTPATNEDGAGHALYTTTVNLVPAVARIEFSAFGMTNTTKDTNIETVDLTKMALVNYSDGATYTATSTGFTVTPTDQKTANITDASVWGYMDGNTSIFTADLTGIELTAGETVTVESWKNTTGTDCLYYHVYPGRDPAIVVTMLADFDGAQSPVYVYSKGLNGEDGAPIDNLEAGHVYRIEYIFDEGNVGDIEKCVQVTVEVHTWEIVPVTPEF